MKSALLKRSESFWKLILSGTVVVCALTAIGCLGRVWWILDLAVNFRVQYLGCLSLAGLLFLAGKRWRCVAVCGVFALVNFVEILPSFVKPGDRPGPSPASITLLLANVNSQNKEYHKVRELIDSTDPDIVVILEATSTWMKELSPFEKKYPHVVSRPREDNFGIALLSRFAFQESEVLELGDAGFPSAMVRFETGGWEVTVIATHPFPPLGSVRSGYRNRQLEAVAKYVRSVERPVVLVGDLNTTPWSPHFKRLLRRTGLRDSRRGQGIQGTWRGLPLIRLPLDHVLHSRDIATLRREVGPAIGSDHLPVIVELALAEARSES
jgi:endonuclease/exonuclease/phosphatase (EEP) superfamily protein YafD